MSPPDSPADRQKADRRRARRVVAADESWFGAFTAEDSIPFSDDMQAAVLPKRAAPPEPAPEPVQRNASTAAAQSPHADVASRLLPRAAARMLAAESAFERIYHAFTSARAMLGLALLVAFAVGGMFGLRTSWAITTVSIAYAALSILTWALPKYRTAPATPMQRLSGPAWLATIGVDVCCFMALHVLAPGSSLNYVALLVLPVLMAGMLTPRTFALATAAAVTFALLSAAWLTVMAGAESTLQMTQAGLAGTGFFVITMLASQLASRLTRGEISARGSLEIARQQAQLNRLVIEEMQDGVLVVDRRGRVRAANPAARGLLALNGLSEPAPFQLRGVKAWDALVKAVERAFSEAAWPEAGRDVMLQFESSAVGSLGAQRTLRVRVRFTLKEESQTVEEFCVLFLEDVRNMQARSRQEKLAAMGRVSAGIAHEIRNPLAAISQANALLMEDVTDPGQKQLMTMVSDNVERLKRIVEDVMEVAPGVVPDVGVIDVVKLVNAVCLDWARATGVELGAGSVLQTKLPTESIGVLFDAEHLRRVLVNLLDNAYRHASREPGSLLLKLESRHDTQAFLSLASDGAPIPPDVEPHLFEPFFSTRSRGTGLGLYICRELCERYDATIDYRLRAVGEQQRNEFYVDMQRRPIIKLT
jgi:two-component system, NtrC family, sensor histidine kinase PilS